MSGADENLRQAIDAHRHARAEEVRCEAASTASTAAYRAAQEIAYEAGVAVRKAIEAVEAELASEVPA